MKSLILVFHTILFSSLPINTFIHIREVPFIKQYGGAQLFYIQIKQG